MSLADAIGAVGNPLLPSSSTMPGFPLPVSTQRPRLTTVLRRSSSAPNVRSPNARSASSVSRDVGTSAPSSSSRSSFSHPEWRPHDLHDQPRPQVTPLASVHDHRRSRRSTSEPVPALTPAPAPAPGLEFEEEISQNMEVMARRLEEIRRNLSMRRRRTSRVTLSDLWVAIRGFFGYGPEGTAARRESMSLAGKLLFGIGQIAATIALLCIAARNRGPENNNLNEWQACQRPLGAWCSVWCVRVVLGCSMAVWAYRRKVVRIAEATGRVDQREPANGRLSPANAASRSQATQRNNSRPQVHANHQVSAATFSRLTTLLSLLSLTWFITAHILTYTSVHTCRLTSPHLWWLTFGIICIGYLVIVEVIVVAFLVFILGPLIFVFLNIILICMGRHPLRHPNHINPEVGKLSHRAVNQIPLVLYIPAPKEKEAPVNEELLQHSSSSSLDEPAHNPAPPKPAHIHAYPPETERAPMSNSSGHGTRVRSRSRRLFTFRRIRLRKRPADDEKGKDPQSATSDDEHGPRYEDKWEKGEYPFVKLEDNRAACAICLCDFDEPRRIRYSLDSNPPQDLDQEEKGVAVDGTQDETEGGLRLTDAGEGAQPLRLLDCAHVFHKTCLDPWLTEVSGRCPVCQKAVEVKEVQKNARTSRWGRQEG